MKTGTEFPLGISTHAFTDFAADTVPVRSALNAVRAAGGATTMLLHRAGAAPWTATREPESTVFDVLASDPREVARACRACGLTSGVIRLTEPTVADNAPIFERIADFVRALGWRTVMFKAPPVPAPLLPLRAKRPLIQACAEFVARLGAAHPDLRWCTDVHYHSSIETVPDAEHFLTCAPYENVGVSLNIGHMTTLHQPGWMLLEKYASRVHAIAWKDHVVGGRNGRPVFSVEAGTGDSPFVLYMRALKAARSAPLHLFCIEDGPVAERTAVCARSHSYLTRLWCES